MYLEAWPNASARKAAPREGTAFFAGGVGRAKVGEP